MTATFSAEGETIRTQGGLEREYRYAGTSLKSICRHPTPKELTALTYDPAGNRIGEDVSSKSTSYWLWPTTVMNYKTTTQFDNLDRAYRVTDRRKR
ncbi:MAG: hypothetical protein ACK5SI_11220 [Planctomycetia bacterium]